MRTLPLQDCAVEFPVVALGPRAREATLLAVHEVAQRQSFEATAVPLMDTLYNVARYLCRNPDDAADLVQETCLRAYRSWHQFSPGTNCKAWLLTILHNVFRNRLRRLAGGPSLVEFDDSIAYAPHAPERANAGDNPADLLVSQSMSEEVQTALDNLPDEFRQVVVLVDLEELTYEEAATVLNCPVGTVRSRLARARRRLFQALQPLLEPTKRTQRT